MQIAHKEKIIKKLKEYGLLKDKNLNLTKIILYISAINKSGISIESYVNRLLKLSSKVKTRHDELISAESKDNAQTKLAALKHVIYDEYNYQESENQLETIDSFDLIMGIDQKIVTADIIALIYINTSRELGWNCEMINFPVKPILRIEQNGERVIFDPANNCKTLNASNFRKIIKEKSGENAELSNEFYETINNRSIITRFINNIKFKLIKEEEYKEALEYSKYLIAICPDDYRPLFDAAILHAKTENPKQAISLLEEYINKAPDYLDRQDAITILEQIKSAIETT